MGNLPSILFFNLCIIMQDLSNTVVAGGLPTDTIGTVVTQFLTRAFNASIDFLFTQINLVFNFLTQPVVLGTLAWLSIIYVAYRWVKWKARSI